MNFLRSLCCAGLTIAASAITPAQVKMSELPGLAYEQNFDRLPAPTEQSPWEWTNDGRQTRYDLAGWYIFSLATSGKPLTGPTAYLSAGGKLPTAVATVNFGLPGDADRAIGFRFSAKGETNAKQHFFAGVVFVNDTKQPIARVSITYTGEQWSKFGGNAETSQTLRVVMANLGAKFAPEKFAAHTVKPVAEIASLEFASVDDATGATTYAKKGPLHTARRTAMIGFPRALAPGEHLLVLWTATGNGTDTGAHSLAVDDVRVQLVPAS